ncbi:hypothetical protein THTE_3133 [Thermogutta terrifontis]|jgi:uncharacterized protein (DUF342 family)|uniref:Uncharacterized protein n=1 Tax=Thermogutta terrifontis TaxID=1331910 RepID=A0A286RIF4_9BACT|nr:hypothetical protein THTE_3133 [Thermogutta terrifontis]
MGGGKMGMDLLGRKLCAKAWSGKLIAAILGRNGNLVSSSLRGSIEAQACDTRIF